jgi:hypothetical protein
VTTKQALAEARRRWGKTACVQRKFLKEHPLSAKTGKPRYCNQLNRPDCAGFHWTVFVGQIDLGMFFLVRGSGETFEAAFAAADKDTEADRERMAKLRAARPSR